MARYPSGLHGDLPGDDVHDVRVRLTQMTLEMERFPIADTADATVARLKRDNPDLAERVIAGDLIPT